MIGWSTVFGLNCYVPVHKGGTGNHIFVSQLVEQAFPKTSEWNLHPSPK